MGRRPCRVSTAVVATVWKDGRMARSAVVRRDEQRHVPGIDGPGWAETFAFELVTDDGIAAAIRVTLHPFERRAWYWALMIRPDEPVVAVVDLDVPLPSTEASLELRSDGLWADHNIETPFEHVSVGLEAFGLAAEDPDELRDGGFGVRTPVGFDLEWESVPRADPDLSPGVFFEATNLGSTRYAIAARAHGELLVGADVFDLDGSGWREHAWGHLDWFDRSWWRRWTSTVTRLADRSVDLDHDLDDAFGHDRDEQDVEALGWLTIDLSSFGDRHSQLTLTAVRLPGEADDPDRLGWIEINHPND
jgi:hypothetical protein